MFTGFIEEIGRVKGFRRGSDAANLIISAKTVMDDIKIGDSVAVNGACLSVVAFTKNEIAFDIMKETLDKTTFLITRTGDYVNLERAVKAGQRLAGHIVSGHIDGVGLVTDITLNRNPSLKVLLPQAYKSFIIPKGSIAIDGISLTIANFKNNIVEVGLINQTIKNTCLQYKKIGLKVNVEIDQYAKVLAQEEISRSSKIDVTFLRGHGFLS